VNPRARPAARGLALATLGGLALTGCSQLIDTDVRHGGYTDGTYSGRSSPDDDGGYGEVSLTITGNDITAATFVLRQADGSVKDADYGRTNGQVISQDTYRKAQTGIAAAPEYAAALVEADSLNDVHAITGASLSHQQFVDAVKDALRSARR
jgi:major membrane immunogen (membrane-anchored lipoprotein)